MVCVNSIHNFSKIRFTPEKATIIRETLSRPALSEMGDSFVLSSKRAEQTNPLLEAVKKAVPMVKEPRKQIAESLHDMIIDTAKAASDARGKDAIGFPVPNHKELVLRIEKSAMGEIEGLPKDLELVPIKHEQAIQDNTHLGLPLYFVTSNSSTIARKNSISPMEALAQPNKIMVLRRVSGQHPAKECGDKFFSMIGFEDFKNPDPNALNNFAFLTYVRNNFGLEATGRCLEMFASGVETIPEHSIAKGCSGFDVVGGKEFYAKYRDFADSYIKSLKDVSEFPQEAYDEAVKFIASPKKFNVDFQHTNNTFVDVEKKEFNFMDFAYDKSDEKYIYENPVKEFRNVLLGKFFRNVDDLRGVVGPMPRCVYPRHFIIEPKDVEAVRTYSKAINDKVNLAAPEELTSFIFI